MKKLMLFLFCMLLVSPISAWEWDNTLKYSEDNLRATFENAFGLPLIGSEIGTATLSSHSYVNEVRGVPLGNNRTVMWYDFKGWELYRDGLGEIEFTNKRTGGKIEREYYFVEMIYGDIEVNDYEMICTKKIYSATPPEVSPCQQVKVGSHFEKRLIEKRRLNTTDIPGRDVRIGLVTDVLPHDYIDGVWTIAGEKVSRHASWQEDYNTNLTHYWKLNESANPINDSVGTMNGSGSGNGFGLDGTSGTAVEFYGDGGRVSFGEDSSIQLDDENFSISAWVYFNESVGANELIIGYNSFASTGAYLIGRATNGNLRILMAYPSFWDTDETTSLYLESGRWHHIAIVRSGSSVTPYVDGSAGSVITGIGLLNITIGETSLGIGSYGDGWDLEGRVDEIGFWTNRSLNASDILALNESGLTYRADFDLEPIATQNLPINGFNSSSKSVTFNFSVTDETQVDNATLWLDGVLNKTFSYGASTDYSEQLILQLAEGNHNWSVTARDNSNQQEVTGNWTFTVDTTPDIHFNGSTPGSGTNSSLINFFVSVNLTETYFNNVTFDLFYENGTLYNSTYYTGGTRWVNFTLLTDGNYTFNATVWTTTDRKNNTDTRYYKLETTPNITYESPTNNTGINTTSPNLLVNVSVTEDYFKNLTFFLYYGNGSLYNSTYFTNSIRSVEWILPSIGNYTFNATVWTTTQEKNMTESRFLSFDNVTPIIDIHYPNSTINYAAIGDTIQLNVTVNDTNLQHCYYIYNYSNTSFDCVSGTLSNTTFILTSQNNITVCANDSLGNSDCNSTNWDFNLRIINITFNSSVHETANEKFSTAFYVLDTDLTNIQLVYNGTNHSISTYSLNGNTVTFSKNIDIPLTSKTLLNETKSFYFRFTNEGNEVIESDLFYQNVSFINLQICNDTFNNQTLNFTFYDEITQTYLNATKNITDIEMFFSYWLGKGTIIKNYSYQNLSSTTRNYRVCLYPLNSSMIFKSDADIEYSSVGYAPNEYHLRNASLTITPNDILLYNLQEGYATKFFLTFKQGVEYLSNAVVTVQKYFVGLGSYKTVGIILTDDSGETTMWQELDNQYKYYVSKNYVLQGSTERISSCTEAPCTKTITLGVDAADVFERYYDDYATGISSNLSYNKTSKEIEYEFIDTTGLANYFRLVVKEVRLNQTTNTICDNSSYSIAGTLTCNLSTYDNTEFEAITYISRSPEKIDQVINVLISEDFIEALGLIGIFINAAILITAVFAGAVITRGSPSGVLWFLGGTILALKLMTIFPFTWVIVVSLEVIILFLISQVKT